MIVIVMGVSGSGKSTIGAALAKRLQIPFVEGDSFHPAENVAKMASGHPLNDEDRQPWLEKLAKVLAEAEQADGCVLACSALKQQYRDTLEGGLSAKPIIIYLDGSKQLLLERLKRREGHFFPVDLLDSQLSTLEIPSDAIQLDLKKSVDELVDKAQASILHRK